MSNVTPPIRPWLDANGELLSDADLKKISNKWTAEVWEQFLADTVEGSSSYQREDVIESYDENEETNLAIEGLWDVSDNAATEGPRLACRRICRNYLTPRQQQVIRSSFWEGLSDPKIAKFMGVARTTVSVQKQRALKKIKNQLEREFPYLRDDKNSKQRPQSKDLTKFAKSVLRIDETPASKSDPQSGPASNFTGSPSDNQSHEALPRNNGGRA